MSAATSSTHRSDQRRRSRRRLVPMVAALACLALVVGACSDDGETGADRDRTTTSTTDGGTDAGSEEPADGDPTTTGPAEERSFDEVADAVSAEMEAASGNLCELVMLSAGMSGVEPADRDEVARAVTLTTDWLIAIAEAAPPESAQQAEVVRNSAEAIQEAAREADYSEEFLQTQDFSALAGPEFTQAVQELTIQCFRDAGGPAAGGPGPG